MQFLIRKKIIFFTVIPVLILYNIIFGTHFYFLLKDAEAETMQSVIEDIRQEAIFINSHIQNLMRIAAMQARFFDHLDTKDIIKRQQEIVLFITTTPLIKQASYIQYMGNDQWHQYLIKKDSANKIKYIDTVLLEQHVDRLIDLEEAAIVENLPSNSMDLIGFWHKPIIPSEVPSSNESSCWEVCYTIPIYQNYELSAFFSTTIDMTWLKRHLEDRLHIYMSISVVDREGVYLYTDSNTPKQFNFETLHQSQYYYGTPGLWHDLKQLIERDQIVFRHEWAIDKNSEYWLVGAPILVPRWWVVGFSSKSKAFAKWIEQAEFNAILMLLSVMLIFGCASFVSLRVTQPIIQLRKCMDEFTNNYTSSVHQLPCTNDEVGSLSHSFHKLILRLADRERQLHNIRTHSIGDLLERLNSSYFYLNLDENGVVTYVSPSVKSILGYSPEQFQRPLIDFLTSQQSRLQLREQLSEAQKGGWEGTFEIDICCHDGSVRQMEMFWSHLDELYGDQCVIEGLANDITDRVSDVRRFKQLLDSAPDATIIMTTEGVISMINSRAEALFCYSRDELVNMPLEILTPHQSRTNHPLLSDLRSANWEQLCLIEQVSRGIDKFGRIFPVEITSNTLQTNEGFLISIVLRDITERKRIEQELMAAKEEAECANQTKGFFLSNISHELRTPLNGVLGNAQLLLRDDQLSSLQRKSLNTIETSGQHLLSLINDILDLTKIESSQVEVRSVSVKLLDLLNTVINMVQERAATKALELRFLPISPLPDLVLLDDTKLRQVLLNLLGNAIKYTVNGWVELRVTAQDDNGVEQLLFEVRDSGVGIANSDLQHVFEPFKQLHQHLQIGGSGLGLSISHRLVDAMGGVLKLDSRVGRGSRFYFSLPYKRSHKELSSVAQINSKNSIYVRLPKDRCHIMALVVAAIPHERELFDNWLSTVGFQVHCVEHIDQAMKLVATTAFALVVMDMVNTDNATDVIKKIRQNSSNSELKIVVISAKLSIKQRQSQHEQWAYIEKPVDIGLLFAKIQLLLKLRYIDDAPVEYNDETELVQTCLNIKYQSQVKLWLKTFDQGDLDSLASILRSKVNDPELSLVVSFMLQLLQDMDIVRLDHFFMMLKESMLKKDVLH